MSHSLNRIVDILLDKVAGGGQQLIDHSGVGRCAVGTHLGRLGTVLQRAGEKPAGGGQISLLGHQHVDDLPILVYCPVQIEPSPGDFPICLLYEPAISRDVPAGSGRVDQQRG